MTEDNKFQSFTGQNSARGGLGPEGDLFAGRLKRRREELGFSQHKLAKAVGLSRNSIQKFEAGTLPRGDNLMALCRVLGVSADWLLGMDEPTYPPLRVSEESASFMEPDRLTPMAGPGPGDLEPPDPGQYAFVPLAEARLGAGGGDWVLSEETAKLLAFRKDWLHGYATARENLVLMTVRGESMEPTIGDGDMVMIDVARRRVHDGALYAIGIGETISVKRLELLATGRVRIISDNRDEYPAYEVHLEDLRILGRIIWLARELL